MATGEAMPPLGCRRACIRAYATAYRWAWVVVRTASGKTAASAWIAPGGTLGPLEDLNHVATTARPTRHA